MTCARECELGQAVRRNGSRGGGTGLVIRLSSMSRPEMAKTACKMLVGVSPDESPAAVTIERYTVT